MTLDECVRLVAEAIQPHLDRDDPNPVLVDEVVASIYKLFIEQPNIEAGFVAAIQALVVVVRKGWTPEDR